MLFFMELGSVCKKSCTTLPLQAPALALHGLEAVAMQLSFFTACTLWNITLPALLCVAAITQWLPCGSCCLMWLSAGAQLVRRIEVPAKDIRWSGGGDLVAIIGESSFYVLRYDRDAVEQAVVSGAELDDDGIEEAFELQTETSEAVRTGEIRLACIKRLTVPFSVAAAAKAA